MNKSIISVAQESKSWPFEEARKILKRLEKSGSNSAVFETGYGASGLPHIGTFGEVARTSMVRHALKVLDKSIETKLICFSDDMDALRKVPDNIPNSEILSENLDGTRIVKAYQQEDEEIEKLSKSVFRRMTKIFSKNKEFDER